MSAVPWSAKMVIDENGVSGGDDHDVHYDAEPR
jgi:hypothetical protein